MSESSVTHDLHQSEKKLEVFITLTILFGCISMLAIITWIYLCYICKKWERIERDRQRHGLTARAEPVDISQQSKSGPSRDNRVTTNQISDFQSTSSAKESEKTKSILKKMPTTPDGDDTTSLKRNASTDAKKDTRC